MIASIARIIEIAVIAKIGNRVIEDQEMRSD
jgi:hypothetical protein